jgi:hypothetical protein
MATNDVTIKCLQDPKCQLAVASKKVVPSENNYPAIIKSVSSDLQATPDGFRVHMRVVAMNATNIDFHDFKIIVSPGIVRQGQPVNPPPIFLIEVELLKAGATGVYYIDNVMLPPGPAEGFACFDPAFRPVES